MSIFKFIQPPPQKKDTWAYNRWHYFFLFWHTIIFISITIPITCVFFRNLGFMNEWWWWWAFKKKLNLIEYLELEQKFFSKLTEEEDYKDNSHLCLKLLSRASVETGLLTFLWSLSLLPHCLPPGPWLISHCLVDVKTEVSFVCTLFHLFYAIAWITSPSVAPFGLLNTLLSALHLLTTSWQFCNILCRFRSDRVAG